MAENVVRVTLPQLVDLSLNCPDMGSMNFNILHILLQVLIKQVQRDDVTVEFRGKDSDRVKTLMTATKPAAPINLTEYNVVGGTELKKKSSKEKRLSLTDVQHPGDKEAEKKEKVIRVIERRKDSLEEPSHSPEPLKSPPGSQTVVLVEPAGVLQSTIAIDKKHFDNMENDIKLLQRQYKELTDMPANYGLIEATRDKASPILDMFQILTLTRRMDASEMGIEKIISLIEDLMKGGAVAGDFDQIKEEIGSVGKAGGGTGSVAGGRYDQLEKRIETIEHIIREGGGQLFVMGAGGGGSEGGGSDAGSLASAQKGRPVLQQGDRAVGEMPDSVLSGVDLSQLPVEEAMKLIQQEFINLREILGGQTMATLLKEIEELKQMVSCGGGDISAAPPEAKINQIESKFTDCVDQINNLNSMYSNQINIVQADIGDLQKDLSDAMMKINSLLPGGDSSGMGEQGILDLYNKFVKLQEEMGYIAETANKLIEEKEKLQENMEGMLEQIDLLKIIKANREDLEDALGDKADACMINRKVSHDQFDAACDDLSRGIEEALLKLTQQEEMWQAALDDIQREIGNKLDKMEVDPLRDFVNAKLKSLQDKFKKLTALKQEQEAAGTKSKYLRDVNCISCDKDVVMRKEMDPSLRPKPHALPPSKNMAPYLAYELDLLRKQAKCIPSGKNLNYFENAIKGAKTGKGKDHVCNRYCGGSHTVTTPQQRVTRLGHFLEQWGPDVNPVGGEEYIRGNDNHMYHGRGETKKTSKDMSQGSSKKSVSKKVSVSITSEGEPKDGSQTDRTGVTTSKDAEDALKSAALKARPKSSMDVLPPKTTSASGLALKRSSQTSSASKKAGLEPLPEEESATTPASGEPAAGERTSVDKGAARTSVDKTAGSARTSLDKGAAPGSARTSADKGAPAGAARTSADKGAPTGSARTSLDKGAARTSVDKGAPGSTRTSVDKGAPGSTRTSVDKTAAPGSTRTSVDKTAGAGSVRTSLDKGAGGSVATVDPTLAPAPDAGPPPAEEAPPPYAEGDAPAEAPTE